MQAFNGPARGLFLWALGAAMWGAGCAPGDIPQEDDAGEALETQAQALAAPACALSELSWTTGTAETDRQVCSGPWEYPTQTVTNPPCPDNGTCPNDNWKTCRHWDWGEEAVAASTKRSSYGQKGQCVSCDLWDIRGGRELCTQWYECDFESADYDADQRSCTADGVTYEGQVLAPVQPTWEGDKVRSVKSSARLDYPTMTGTDVYTGKAYFAANCNLSVSYSIPKEKKGDKCGCSEPLKNETCPTTGPLEWRQSAADLLRENLPTDAKNASCSTCQQLPLRGPDDAQKMFDCLTGLASNGTTAAIRQEAKRRGALVFERFGSALSAQSYATGRGWLLSVAPSLTCGTSALAGDYSCLSEGDRAAAREALSMCKRLTASHVSAEVVRGELPACMDAIERFEAGASSCNEATRSEVRALLDALTAQSLSSLIWSASSTEQISDALGRIERWYAAASRQERGDQEKLLARMSPVFATFWSALYADTVKGLGVAAAGASDAALVTALSDASGKRTEAQLTVLSVAYGDKAPLTGPALLLLTSDALSPILEAATQRARFVDVACRYKDCSREAPNQIAALVHVLSSLFTEEELKAALPLYARALTPTMSDAFSKLAANHQRLRMAHATLVGRAARLTELRSGEPPKLAAGLQSVAFRAQAAHRSLLKTGFFRTPVNLLHFGVNEEVRTRLLGRIDTARQGLTQELNAYRGARMGVARELLSQLDRRQYAAETERRAEELYHRTEEVVADLSGIRQRDGAEAVRLGFVTRAVQSKFSEPQLQNTFVFDGSQSTISVSGAQARYIQGSTAAIDAIAVRDDKDKIFRVQTEINDRLLVDVANNWSPSCAIKKVMATSSVLPFGDGASEAVTGPEGFWLESVGMTGRVRSLYANEERYTRKETSTRTCVGVSGSAGVGIQTPVYHAGVDVTASTERCESTARGTSSTKGSSTTSSTEQRMSARFNLGMRVPGTPFADAPAGALLLVALPRNESDLTKATDVMVATPGSVLTFSKPSDVYLVVNDNAGCEPLDSTKKLAVSLQRHRPVSALATEFAVAQTTVQRELREQLESLLSQGSIGASELSQLRVRANRELVSRLGVDLNRLPGELIDYTADFIETELASLERKARQLTLMRELDHLRRETLALRADMVASQQKMRLGDLLLSWHLMDLAAPELEDIADEYVRLTSEYVYPVLQLRHPRALAEVAQHRSLKDLLATTLDTPFDKQVDALASFGSALSAALGTQIEASDVKSKVTLAVPRPNTSTNTAYLNQHRAVDATRAAAFWNAVAQNKPAPLTVELRDLYEDRNRPAARNILACAATAPVIDSVGVYGLAYGNSSTDDWSQGDWPVTISSGPYLSFPQSSGVADFEIDETARNWLVTTVPMKFGDTPSLLSNYESSWIGNGYAAGLSPFNTFQIALQNVNSEYVQDTDVIFVTFSLRTKQTLDGLTRWLETCNQYKGKPDDAGVLPVAPLPPSETLPAAPIATPIGVPALVCNDACTAGQNRCSGALLERCTSLATGCTGFTTVEMCAAQTTCDANLATCVPVVAVEQCTNRIDDDLDGLIDCADYACAPLPVCRRHKETCFNGFDDNGDGDIDCDDLDCVRHPACRLSIDPIEPPTFP